MTGAPERLDLARRLTAEAVGTALLLATVVGSGIMGERLAAGNAAVALLANTLATGAGLVALILTFGPISGAHFNPAVTLAVFLRSKCPAADVVPYWVAQIAGAAVAAGAVIFVFLTANFYASLATRVTGVDVSSESFRNRVSPLNTPTDPNLVAAVRDASTSSFHLAMLIGAALLVAGAIVNWFGIQNEAAKPEEAEVSTKEPVSSAPA